MEDKTLEKGKLLLVLNQNITDCADTKRAMEFCGSNFVYATQLPVDPNDAPPAIDTICNELGSNDRYPFAVLAFSELSEEVVMRLGLYDEGHGYCVCYAGTDMIGDSGEYISTVKGIKTLGDGPSNGRDMVAAHVELYVSHPDALRWFITVNEPDETFFMSILPFLGRLSPLCATARVLE